jgi:hypothetical protein
LPTSSWICYCLRNCCSINWYLNWKCNLLFHRSSLCVLQRHLRFSIHLYRERILP